MCGTDSRFNTAAGLETRGYFQIAQDGARSGFMVRRSPQFYLEAAYNDLKVKVGHFYAPVGYEVVPTTGNFFPNLPYTFQYGEPFTMTGVLATWQYNENVSLGGGIDQGWDNFDSTRQPARRRLIGTYTEKFSGRCVVRWCLDVGNEPNTLG